MRQTTTGVFAGVMAFAMSTTAAQADTNYDTVTPGNDGEAFFGDLVLDDLTIEGGGLLQSVTIVLAGTGSGQDVAGNATMSLALDGGDGLPDVDGTGDDALLFQAIEAVVVPVNGTIEVEFDLAETFTIIPPDALLFGGVEVDNPLIGHVFGGDPAPGSTTPFVFSFNSGGPTAVPSVTDPELENSDGLSFRIETVALPPISNSGRVVGDAIDFEALEEGFLGESPTVDGVTFSEGRDGFAPPIDAEFAIDDGSDAWNESPAMLDFVQGKLIQLNGWAGGGGYLFTIMKSLKMTTGKTHTGARLSVAYITEILDGVDYTTGTITLMALNDGVPIAMDQQPSDNVLGTSSGGTFTFGASTLQVTGVEFDELVLFNNGPGLFGTLQMGIDNLTIGDDSPGSWQDLGYALAGTHGFPLARGAGAPQAGAPFELSLTNALENALAYALVGTAPLNAPFLGGILVPDPTSGLVVLLTTDPTGMLQVADRWPTDLVSGTVFLLQWWIVDPGGPQGVAASNALSATVP